MDRRAFLRLGSGATLAIGALGLSATALARIVCTPFDRMGLQQCEAGIRSDLAHVSAA